MKTTYFWKVVNEPAGRDIYVSISRTQSYGCELPEYSALMPSWDLINLAKNAKYSKESLEEYRKRYYEQLSKLDAREVYNELQDKTLVCFESSKDIASGKKYCHRRMIAGWIETELGIVVPEEVPETLRSLYVPAIYSH